ncbi:hypothetical protein CDCA_CDCA11G3122 [Cyanidium caldarium]|uniref:Uncharacterized protein n=1 Tax=Cyanidium caldarium TaxID=2771 RepID=A0AAV9IXU2_CYACA|nr:hypothetical protein CDCA_CDCA11G3122 [Cyanidium caldarium]
METEGGVDGTRASAAEGKRPAAYALGAPGSGHAHWRPHRADDAEWGDGQAEAADVSDEEELELRYEAAPGRTGCPPVSGRSVETATPQPPAWPSAAELANADGTVLRSASPDGSPRDDGVAGDAEVVAGAGKSAAPECNQVDVASDQVLSMPVIMNAAVRPKRWSLRGFLRRMFLTRRGRGDNGAMPLSDGDSPDRAQDEEGAEEGETLSAAMGDFSAAQHSWDIHAHRLVVQPDRISYAIAVNREAMERKEQLCAAEQRQAAEQSRLQAAASQFRSLFIRDTALDEAIASGDADVYEATVTELEMHERRSRTFRVLLLFDSIFFLLLGTTWIDALITQQIASVSAAVVNGVVCAANMVIDAIGLRAVSIESSRLLSVFIALYWVSLVSTVFVIPLLPLIPLLRFLLLPMAASIRQVYDFRNLSQHQGDTPPV